MNFLARFALAAASLATFALPALRATDPALDAGFVSTISPGLTPASYVPPPAEPDFTSGTGAVNAVALLSDGKILAGGNISRYQTSGDLTALKRLLPTGASDPAFNPSGAGLAASSGQPEVNILLADSADRAYVGGTFSSYNGVARSGILRLLPDGTLDPAFAPFGLSGSVRYARALALQPDGKLLVGGGFTFINSTFRRHLARLNADGTLDTAFDPNVALSLDPSTGTDDVAAVGDIALLPDGRLLVAATNTSSRPVLLRLFADGTLDPSFSAALATTTGFGAVNQLALLPDGRIAAAGFFTLADTGAEVNFAVFRADGSLDTAFNTALGAGPNGSVLDLLFSPDGRLLASGIFTEWDGQSRASLALLNLDGTLDPVFSPVPYTTNRHNLNEPFYLSHLYSLAVQPDGKLLAGGWFARISDPTLETYNLTRFVFGATPASPGAIRLLAPVATVAENAGSLTLQISRFGGTTGTVTAQITQISGGPGRATAGSDFTAINPTLTWAPGEGGLKTITIPILQDTAVESSETFDVTILTTTGGATVPAGSGLTRVTLRDDDSAPAITRQPAPVTTEQGSRVTFSVRYDSVLTATVKWQRDPDGLGVGAAFADIPGATAPDYVIPVSDPALHNGHYRAVVTSPSGSTSSSAAELFVAVPAGSVINTVIPPAISEAIVATTLDANGRLLIGSSFGLRRYTSAGAADPTFTNSTFTNPTFPNLPLTAVHLLADGRILVGGFFTTVANGAAPAVSRPTLARFSADGVLDSSFVPSLPPPASGTLYANAIASAASGKVYVGFGAGGRIRRNKADGTPDATVVPPATLGQGNNGLVIAIRELADGTVLVAHLDNPNFSTINYRLSRLTTLGALDPAFGASGSVAFPNTLNGFNVLPDGRIAVAGSFATLAGATQQYVGLLGPTGVPDTDFVFTGVLNNSATGVSYRDGRLLVWGPFSTVNGATQGNLVRLNLDGSVDSTFSVGAGASGNFGYTINSALYTNQGDLFVAGQFTAFKGVARNSAALLVANPLIGTIGFAPARASEVERNGSATLTLRRYGPASEAVSIRYTTADGTALAGTDYVAATGTVTWAAGDSADKTLALSLLDDAAIEPAKTFRVLLSDPTGPATPAASATITLLDSDTLPTFTAQPSATQTNLSIGGAIVLNVSVSSPTPATYQWFLNGVPLPGITGPGYVQTPVTLHDAGLYTVVVTNAAGSVTSQPVHIVISPQPGRPFSGQPTTGRPQFDNFSGPSTLVALPDGGALLGGFFSANAGLNRPQANLLRIRADGTTNPTFTVALNSAVVALRAQSDGKIVVFGNFTTVNSVAQRYLFRLNADLTFDTAFNTAVAAAFTTAAIPNGYSALGAALDSTGRIYLSLSSGGGIIRRVNANGTLDSSYLVASSSTGSFALAVDSSDRLLVGGNYTNIGPVATIGASPSTSPARPRLARLAADGTVDQTFLPSVGSLSFRDLAIHPATGRIYAGLDFTPGIIEILADGSPTVTNIGSNDSVSELALSPDGRPTIVRSATGAFKVQRYIPGATPGAAAATDTAYSTGTGPNGNIVTSLAYRPDGSLWIAGDFTTVNGVTTAGVALLQPGLGDPGIVNPPVRLDANAGATGRLSVGATGTGLTYQWLKAGLPLANDARITGVTAPVLSIAGLTPADDALYSVTVTSTTPGSFPLTSIAVKINVLGAPVVSASPANQTPALGATVTLAADVLAATPANYVWRRDGVLILNGGRYSGATTAKLVITGANASDNGAYVLTVTNPQGTASTTPANLAVAQIATDRDPATTALSATNRASAFLHLPDGRTLVGTQGNLAGAASTSSTTRLSLIETDGRVTPSALGVFNGEVSRLIRQPDGKILVLGGFTAIGANSGAGFSRFVRLNADLTRDTTLAPYLPTVVPTTAVVDAQGRIYLLCGVLDYEGRTGYNFLVRLNPDGTHDLGFNLSLDSSVRDLALQPDGKILVAGEFRNYGTTPAKGLLRLNADGSVDTAFASAVIPAAVTNYNVASLAVDSQGRALAGYFYFNGTFNYGVARLLPTGALDPAFTFTETMDQAPSLLVPLPGDQILVAGSFSTPVNSLVRLNANGSRDTAYSAALDPGFGNFAVLLRALVPDASGRLWIGGDFTTFKGASAIGLVVLQGSPPPALAFTSPPATQVRELGATATLTASATGNNGFAYQWLRNGVPLTDGGRISGATTPTLVITGLLATDDNAYSVRITSPSGTLTSPPARLAVLAAPEITANPADLTRDLGTSATFSASARGAGTLSYRWLHGSTELADGTVGGVTIAGATTSTLTITGPTFAQAGEYRLRATNTLGTATSAPARLTVQSLPGALAKDLPAIGADGPVLAILRLNDGSMLVGGQFSNITINGVLNSRVRIARFLANGTLDPNFNPVFNNSVRALAQDSAGRVFVGGDFTQVTFGGVATPRIRVARLTSALALDTAFDTSVAGPTGADNSTRIVYTLAPVGDGSVFVGGSFTAIGAATTTVGAITAGVNRVARLGPTGALDASFVSYADANVRALLRLPDGSLFIAGESTSWNSPGVTGNPNARIVKLSATGTRLTFAPLPAVSGFFFPNVHSLLRLADGSLLVGGVNPVFSTSLLTRLNADTGAQITDYVTTLAATTPTAFAHSGTVAGLAQQTDGKILSGSASRLFRTTVAGLADKDTQGANFFGIFEPGTINAIALDGTGRIWVVGTFTVYNSRSQDRIAIFNGRDVESRDGLLAPQTVTFTDIPDRTFGDTGNTLTLAATSDQNLTPVTFAVTSGPATVSGSTLTVTGAGDITVTATQAGNSTIRSATATQTFTVAKATQTITFAALANKRIGDDPFTVSATTTAPGLTVSFSVSGPATISGNTITLASSEGTVTVTASQDGDANYAAAESKSREFTVSALTAQTITIGDITDRVFSATASANKVTLSATATSGLAPIVFAVTSGPASVTGNTLTITGVGDITVSATQAGNGVFASASATQTFTVTAPPPASQRIDFKTPAAKIFGAAPFDLVATAIPSGLPVVFTVVSGPATIEGKTITLTGAGSVRILASQPGNAAYGPATPTVEQTLIVNKAPQTLAFTVPVTPLPLSTTPLTLSGTATPSGLPVTFTVVSGAATLEGASLTFTGTGPVKLRATQAGNENYLAAKPLEKTITVTSTATLTLGELTTPYDGEDHAVTVTGVPPGFEDDLVVTYNGSRNLPRNAGTYTVVASLGALKKSAKLTITKAPLLLSGVDVFRVVGAADPAFTLGYEGFKGTDASAPITSIVPTAPRISTSAKTNSNAGVYPFLFKGGVSPNYILKAAPEPGALTVKGFGGTYEALLVDGDLLPVGKLSLTIPPNALSYSGTLTTAREAKTVSFKSLATKLFIPTPDAMSASVTDLLVTVGGTAYDLDLTVNAIGVVVATGDINGDGTDFTATVAHAARVKVFAKGATIPGVGANTLALHPAFVLFDEDQGPIPGGSGHATAAIAAGTGVLTVKGFVADGLPLTASLKPTQGDAYLLYANPYGARPDSFIAGRLALQSHPDQTRFKGRFYIPFEDGLLIWQKAPLPDTTLPAKQDKSYRAGFGPLGIQVSLDPWIAPATRATTKEPIIPAGTLAQRLGLTGSATVNISHGPEALDFGDSEDSLPFQGMLSAAGALTAGNASATSWTIKITPATGAFTGSFKLVDAVFVIPKPPSHDTIKFVPRTVTFSGTLRQAPADEEGVLVGTGFFLVPALPVPAGTPLPEQPSGEIRFTAPVAIP
ncbi:MAG: hypothetical protein H7067_05215 [Burkholderiales bacterium]|nr:hypothetical protein [Opitutaceae bacterium]